MKLNRFKFYRDSLIAALFFGAAVFIPTIIAANPAPWQITLGLAAGFLWYLRMTIDLLAPIETIQILIDQEYQLLLETLTPDITKGTLYSPPQKTAESLRTLLNRYRNGFITQEKAMENLKEMNRTHEIMLELSNSVLRMEDTDALFQTILSKAIEVVPAGEYGSLMVLNNEMKFEFKAVYGFDPRLYTIQLDPKESFQWHISGNFIKEPTVIKEIQQLGKEYMDTNTYDSMTEIRALDLQTTLCAPIIINNDFYGSINIDSTQRDAFTDHDLTLMKYFANQAAIVIKNHMLLDRTLHLSRIDTLTGIYNRSQFDSLFDDFLTRSKRYPEKCSLILMDLDGLKKVNDTWGHLAGDSMLKHFASQLKNKVRDSDLFARYGGDEFILVFFNSTPEQTGQRMVDINTHFSENALSFEQSIIPILFSYGIAQFPDEAKDYKTLVHLADERMYTQKIHNRAFRKEKSQPIKELQND